jgi:ADP-ribosylglycohydrolase
LAGGVWGNLVGDAMGVPYEFGPPVPVDEVSWGHQAAYRPQAPGTWSDDGGLMLALLDSLVESGFDPKDQGQRALAWWLNDRYRPGPLFDIGVITQESLERIRRGVDAAEAGGLDERDNGNGSLMRILPVALVGYEQAAAELIEQATRASSLTHRHPRSQVACALYVLIASALIRGSTDSSAVLRHAFDEVAANASANDLTELALIEHYESRGGSGYVVDSFWSAWDSFESASSYAEAIRRAISYGDDTDTTACIAGGLAGIYFGVGGIPRDWLAGMRGTEIVTPIVDRLLKRKAVR